MAWDAGRRIRGDLDHEHDVRVRVRCARCNRIMRYLYGTVDFPAISYWKGYVPGPAVISGYSDFTCHARCGAAFCAPMGQLVPAYRLAARRVPSARELVLPTELAEPHSILPPRFPPSLR